MVVSYALKMIANFQRTFSGSEIETTTSGRLLQSLISCGKEKLLNANVDLKQRLKILVLKLRDS